MHRITESHMSKLRASAHFNLGILVHFTTYKEHHYNLTHLGETCIWLHKVVFKGTADHSHSVNECLAGEQG